MGIALTGMAELTDCYVHDGAKEGDTVGLYGKSIAKLLVLILEG